MGQIQLLQFCSFSFSFSLFLFLPSFLSSPLFVNVRPCGIPIIWCSQEWSCVWSLLALEGPSRYRCQLHKPRLLPVDSSSYCFHFWHVEVVKLLLVHPNINVNLKDSDDTLPFHLVVTMAKCLLFKCCWRILDVTLEDGSGRTPLWWASREGHLEIIEWFFASGRDLGDINEQKGKWGGNVYTALEMARDFKRKAPLTNTTPLSAAWFLTADPDTVRFFAIASELPIELQMMLCHRVFDSKEQSILRQDSEAAFKSLAMNIFCSWPA